MTTRLWKTFVDRPTIPAYDKLTDFLRHDSPRSIASRGKNCKKITSTSLSWHCQNGKRLPSSRFLQETVWRSSQCRPVLPCFEAEERYWQRGRQTVSSCYDDRRPGGLSPTAASVPQAATTTDTAGVCWLSTTLMKSQVDDDAEMMPSPWRPLPAAAAW